MKISFYHYIWPHYLAENNSDFKQKISEYLVIYQLAKALEENGEMVIRYAKESDHKYLPDKNIYLFHKGMRQIYDFIKFVLNPPDFLCLVSKSIFHSKKLVPLIRIVCRLRNIKFIIFMGHDESKTSTKVLENVKPYKYEENNFWNNPEDLKNRIKRNELYRPKYNNEYVCVPAKIIKTNLTKEGWNHKQILLLPHGIDSKYFQSSKIKTISNKFKILYAGNGATRKGLAYIIRAFERLTQKYNNIELSILSHNVNHIKVNNINIYHDIKDKELLGLYQSHDIFVMPSLLDGWGLTVMEAMSCELPVIVTPLTGISDIISNKNNGFIVKTKSDKEIYRVIKHLINNPNSRKIVGQNARKTINKFSWNDISHIFTNQLKSISNK